MEQRNLGRSGLKVSEISFGPGNWSITDEAEALRMIGRALDLGVTTFDTANFESGGRIEEWIGTAIRGRRHEVVICTKFSGGASRRHIMREVEGSLRRLGVECLDLYQFHAWDPKTPIEESLSALTTLVRQGKVLYLGCCWFTSWQICKTNWMAERHGCEPLVSISPKFNMLGQDIFYPYTLGEVLEKDLLPFCLQEGIGVIGYRPLAGGLLTGKYRAGEAPPPGTRFHGRDNLDFAETARQTLEIVEQLRPVAVERGETLAQLALAWALTKPGISSVLVGANSMAQLEENLAAAGHRLSEEELRRVDEIRRPLRGLVIG
jgi:aryl-alcohol dehydrogenase-like predicted oxidoreductase